MQISKIDSTNFGNKLLRPAKNLTNIIKNPENIKLASSLTALASLGMVAVNKDKMKDKSFEKTLEENYFKLPADAKPDIFQKASAAYLYNGNDVLVTAPTGTGKTAIANYITTKNLEEGKKTFYTTPLKALSNEKYRSFQKIYGEENVGLITGDVKENKEAPIIIMTTEVYRNMVFSEQFKRHNPILDNLKTVIFDELHYLGDVDRGGVWEQSIIFSNPKVQLLSLSATIGNNDDIAKWMAKSRKLGYHQPKILVDNNKSDYNSIQNVPQNVVGLINVPSENRHVPLEFSGVIASGEKIQTSKVKKKDLDIQKSKYKPKNPIGDDYRSMVSMLRKEDKLPAIFFIFSKKACKNVLDHLAHFGAKLNNEEEVEKIREIVERYKTEGKYLGETLNLKAIEKGYAIHNSGLLPVQKELVEELFQKKLIKVVLATETLSAGINMPARTTVVSSYLKPTSEITDENKGKRELTPNEFHQMAGRAGRRGIDIKGYCYTMSMDKEQKAIFDKLVESAPNELVSAFNKPDYNFVVGYYDISKDDELIKDIAGKSFFAYSEKESVSQEKQKDFLKNFGLKRKALRKFDFMDSENKLTVKGALLTKLNGYEQIPVINAIESKRLGGLNPVELAGAVGALANIRLVYEPKNNNNEKKDLQPFHHKNTFLDYVITTEINKIKHYNQEMSKINSNHRNVEFNESSIHHVYAWADYNNTNESSTENWKRILSNCNVDQIRDEGTLFREIAMTIDLLKQIIDISDEGIKVSSNDIDKKYYNDLKETARESIVLLSKTPVV